jgi:hypothetical protein
MTTRPVAKQRGGASNHIIADNTRSGRWRQAFSAALRSGRVDVAHGVLLLRISCPSAALPFHSVGARPVHAILEQDGSEFRCKQPKETTDSTRDRLAKAHRRCRVTRAINAWNARPGRIDRQGICLRGDGSNADQARRDARYHACWADDRHHVRSSVHLPGDADANRCPGRNVMPVSTQYRTTHQSTVH